jgi:hypothetical protein
MTTQAAITLIILSVGGYYAYNAIKSASVSVANSTTTGKPLFPGYALPKIQLDTHNITNWDKLTRYSDDYTYDENDKKWYKTTEYENLKAKTNYSFVPVSVYRRNPHMFDLDIPIQNSYQSHAY